MIITILTLNTFCSVRFAHSHVLSKLADTSLNAYYYTLRTDSCDHTRWSDTTVSKAVKVVSDSLETYSLCADERIRKYGEEDINYLPLACYQLHWNIEASYYEGKTFWSLEEYRIRSREGIERLINLLAVSYSEIILFSYIDANFSSY